jgi:hypothetical protein
LKITGTSRVMGCPNCGKEVDCPYQWTGGPNCKGNDFSYYMGVCPACKARVALLVHAGEEERNEFLVEACDLRVISMFGLGEDDDDP